MFQILVPFTSRVSDATANFLGSVLAPSTSGVSPQLRTLATSDPATDRPWPNVIHTHLQSNNGTASRILPEGVIRTAELPDAWFSYLYCYFLITCIVAFIFHVLLLG